MRDDWSNLRGWLKGTQCPMWKLSTRLDVGREANVDWLRRVDCGSSNLKLRGYCVLRVFKSWIGSLILSYLFPASSKNLEG